MNYYITERPSLFLAALFCADRHKTLSARLPARLGSHDTTVMWYINAPLIQSRVWKLARYPCAVLVRVVFLCRFLDRRLTCSCALCRQSVQYAAAVFGGYGLFEENLKLLIGQRNRFGEHTFKQSHALAKAFRPVLALLLFLLLN